MDSTRPVLYFVRPNGITSHNDPAKPDAFVVGEPPTFPKARFNYAAFSLEHSLARIGWPDTGDLRNLPAKHKALANAYGFDSLPSRVQGYLKRFRKIAVDSVVLMPDPDCEIPGTLYIGTVSRPYDYVPVVPYECAHRIGVEWDRDGDAVQYSANELGIGIQGGWWLWAFHALDGVQWTDLCEHIARVRRNRTAKVG